MRSTNAILALLVGALTAATPLPSADISGEWVARVLGSTGAIASTITFTQDGGRLQGVHLANTGARRPFEGRVEGDSVSFSYPAMGREGVIVRYRGMLVTPDSLVGEVLFPERAAMDFTAARRR